MIVFLICRLNSLDVCYWASQVGNWIVMIDWFWLILIDWYFLRKRKLISLSCHCDGHYEFYVQSVSVLYFISYTYIVIDCTHLFDMKKTCSICFLHWSIDLMFSALDPLKLIKFLTAYQINSNHALVLQMRRIELIPGQRGWSVGTSMQTHGQWPRRIT